VRSVLFNDYLFIRLASLYWIRGSKHFKHILNNISQKLVNY